ncbi:ester cyclase [Pedosphaera parvula]|nr:ester cyclase [Pedosphaera parvula]
MAKENATVVARWFEEVWNQGKVSTINELMAKDGLAYGLGAGPIHGPKGFLPFFQQIKSAFPDVNIKCEQFVTEGDLVATRWSATMTHGGHFLGKESTGKQVKTDGMSICRIRDGQILESWNNWDLHGVMQQLG